jgi:hypothetical protein
LIIALAASLSCKKKERAADPPAAAASLPGVELDAALAGKLAAALAARGPDYVPRTRHKDATGEPRYTNRLILEASPYLLQHAHNPVNWFPWGDEAFAEARRLGRPVFLSIGYSTCHWCHVMEEESFEDPEIARVLNERYIAIKVDREERPDIDSIYMAAVQAMGQGGGWPLNVWLTADREPFFGGTYFAPRAGVRGARVGFVEILARAREQFDKNPAGVAAAAKKIAGAIAASNQPPAGAEIPGPGVLLAAAELYRQQIDRVDGGLRPPARDRSKFPSAFPNRALLRVARRSGDGELRDMVAMTLRRMAAGGIYDQLGGGFHRYSTDPQWLVPHFEKMLYDNAQLAVAYLEGYQATGDPELARIAGDILAYVAREMTAASGGFYSATDADSLTASGEREEGVYFVWSPDQLRAALGDDAQLAAAYWGVEPGGNWEGASILTARRSAAEVGAGRGLDESTARDKLGELRDKLLAVRARRPPPLRDDKILAAWNGLMISGFARAARVLGDGRHPDPRARGARLDYLSHATRAADFVQDHMIDGGRLARAYRDGRAYNTGFAEDYAFVIAGFIDLFEASGDPRWLARALSLQKTFDAHYRGPSGAYYQTADDAEVLLAREIPDRDGAIPSANSVAALNLLRLYELTSDAELLAAADRILAAFAPTLAANPAAMSELLLAVDFRHDVARQVVLVAPAELGQLGALDAVVARSFAPSAVVIRAVEGDEPLARATPLADGKSALRGEPTAYVCEQNRCKLPTRDPAVLASQLAEVNRLESPGRSAD